MSDKKLSVVVHSTPTSLHSAELSEIVLDETTRTRTLFLPVHVDNPNDRTKQLKGTFVFQKPKVVGDGIRLTRKDIKAGEYVELSLSTTETFNLARGLADYFRITSNRMTAVWDVDYVQQIPNDALLQAIRTRPEIIELLSQEDIDLLGIAMRVRELKNVRETISQNMGNGDEQYWQELFEKYPWVLSQLFALPYMFFQSQAYVGGKNIRGHHGRYADFLYQNHITGNVAIVEIKTPLTDLIYDAPYRDQIYSSHKDTSGAISQLLNQRDTLYKEYSNLIVGAEENERFDALNFQCILIAGNVSALDSIAKRKSFELYRNEMRNICIIGFDELLQKLDTMIQLMTLEEPE